MPSFETLIGKSGKGLLSNKDLIYLLDINIGGTIGTYTCANIGRDIEGNFYKSKLQSTGAIHRSVQPENGQFETSDLNVTLANGDLEFSKYPWNYVVLNKSAVLKMGFAGGNSTLQYLADCSYLADGSITASCSPLGAGSPGDISAGIAYTLYKGIIKRENRSNKQFNLSIGDYTNKIFVGIPPRTIDVNEFPRVGTSVMVLGTKTDADTSLVGKGIPYIYGDFSSVSLIQPLFVDTFKNRYLIADHPIGTISKVISGGTQVYNFVAHTAGTGLIGTYLMSFIDFGTSQGTKNVYVSITGRIDSIREVAGTIVTPDSYVQVGPYYGASTDSAALYQPSNNTYISGTVGIGSFVTVGCYVRQHQLNAGYVGMYFTSFGQITRGTATSIGTWQWVTATGKTQGNSNINFNIMALNQTQGVEFNTFRAKIGTYLAPAVEGIGTGIELNGDFETWTNGTSAGTTCPDNWKSYWTAVGVPIITSGTYVVSYPSYNTSCGTFIENPALILKDILLSSKICGLSLVDIGTTSFDTSEFWLNNYKFRYIMNGDIHKNSIDLIQNLSVCSLSTFHFDKDNLAQFDIYRPAVSRTNIKKIKQTDILEDSFLISRDVRDVYNKATVNYDYDWINKKYRNEYKTEGTTYTTKFDTVKTFTLDAPFIYLQAGANFACRRWLSKLQNGLSKVNFELPLSKMPIDVGDRLQLTHEEPSSPSGGWNNRLINIYECEIDNKGKKIAISAIDEDEVNFDKKYFILGNGTAFYRSASENQRYYGALCVGGTMSDGDGGYILW